MNKDTALLYEKYRVCILSKKTPLDFSTLWEGMTYDQALMVILESRQREPGAAKGLKGTVN